PVQSGDFKLSLLPTAAPSITLVAPTDGAKFYLATTNALTNVTVTATASDSDGTIQKVEFGLSGSSSYRTLIVTNAPFSLVFSNLTADVYYLSAVATDNLGARSTTNISFNIFGPPPLNDNFADRIALAGTN